MVPSIAQPAGLRPEGHTRFNLLRTEARSADKLRPLVQQIRADGGQAHDFGSDARKEEDMVGLIEQIERGIAPIEVAVFNVGANVSFPITETTARVYIKVWEMGCFGGFRMGREAAKVMLPHGRGTIIFTGASASLRGREGFAAFAGAKHALRALAQSMARELWPKGIHVAHAVIDGAIDTSSSAATSLSATRSRSSRAS